MTHQREAITRLTKWRVNGNLSGQYTYNPYSGNLTAKGTTALSYAPVPGNPGVTGLAAWWSLNETSGTRLDSQGTSALNDHNSTGYTTGVKNNAARFVPANNNYLTAADSAALSTLRQGSPQRYIPSGAEGSTLREAEGLGSTSLASRAAIGGYSIQCVIS